MEERVIQSRGFFRILRGTVAFDHMQCLLEFVPSVSPALTLFVLLL